MKNVAYIIVAGCLWGIISLFVTGLSSLGFSSMQVVAIRVACSALILVGFMLVKDASLLKIRLRDIPLFLGSGLLSIVFFNFCYFEAIEVIGGAAVPALLLYTAPLFVMLLSLVLFKEPLTKRKVVSLMLALAGLGLVTGAFSSGQRFLRRRCCSGSARGSGMRSTASSEKSCCPGTMRLQSRRIRSWWQRCLRCPCRESCRPCRR